MKKCNTGLIGMAAVTLGLMTAGSQALAAGDTIKVGTFLAVTGPASFLGDPELKTLQLYIEAVNAKGGIDGKQVELIHYDTGGNAKEAVSFAKRLIKQDKVDVIVGGSTSGSSLAVMPEMYADMKKRGITKVALISGDGGFGKSGRAQSLALAAEYGISIVADESYGRKDSDMTAQVTNIRASDAQAILNFGFGSGPAIVTKNIRQLGVELPLYQSHGVASKKYIELAGDAAEGVRLPASALLVADKLADSDPQKSVLMAYGTAYEAAYGPVSTFGGHAYDGLMIALEAIDRANSTDKDKVRDQIEATKNFIGTGGVFNMSKTDHMGLGLDAFRMLEIRNGDWTLAN